MGQAVKYAALGAAFVIVLALLVVVVQSVTGQEVSGGFSAAVTTFVSNCGSFLQNVRGALNYACGSGSENAFTLLIWLNIILPLSLVPIRLVVAVHRWVNQ